MKSLAAERKKPDLPDYSVAEEMMAERGIAVSYEPSREWCLKLPGACTKQIRSHGAQNPASVQKRGDLDDRRQGGFR